MISLGSLDDVVFMLHVKRNDRGLISPLSFTTFLKIKDSILLDCVKIIAIKKIKLSVKIPNKLYSYPMPPAGRCTNCGTGLGCGPTSLTPELSNVLKQ